ncbi:C1 family peptidase [Fulvivirgaceae bacterium BMA10]|uniref:Aminopeptidase n=1 Tax=Splendidivirga corallicola TaxID=3051826 RepID=A0ABT8KWY3_9BACT|nr:C1 family peptidase [Fulvivirgaceae bacterium BMA10]
MKLKRSIWIGALLVFIVGSWAKGQEKMMLNDDVEIVVKNKVEVTSVKSQDRTGTCWSFATSSFIESEALRKGKGEHDISEMYFVRQTYPKKADNFVRRHGNATFGAGSLSHDVIIASKEFGVVPEEIYTGLSEGERYHNHGELQSVLKGFLDGLIKNRGGNLNPKWKGAYEAILNTYLGEVPQSFVYQGKEYTPMTFAKEALDFNPNDYVEITSFTHRPYYEKFILNIPDNWANASYFNVPLDEFEQIMDHALANGYSIAWDGDVSEKEFVHQKGIAYAPSKKSQKSSDEKNAITTALKNELQITEEMRQNAYDNYSTSDDHLMHIVGLVTDKDGKKYYLTKNSWGTDNDLGGYLYMTQSYVRLKSIAIMIHKDALPESISKKMGV